MLLGARDGDEGVDLRLECQPILRNPAQCAANLAERLLEGASNASLDPAEISIHEAEAGIQRAAVLRARRKFT